MTAHRPDLTDSPPVPVYVLSDSTGISAETMASALLLQFPAVTFERHVLPFITTVDEARAVVERIDADSRGPAQPLVFMTVVDKTVRAELRRCAVPTIDFVGDHMPVIEKALGRHGDHRIAALHGTGDQKRYNRRMAAVEFAIEHDDGQSLRALEKADLVLIAPSRCGKTPTSMFLALQHGLFVANYPLIDEDLEVDDLPRPLTELRDRCFGLVSSPQRLHEVRSERRPGSRYASEQQVVWELTRAQRMYRRHRIPFVDTSTRSVEEIATIILQKFPRAGSNTDKDVS